MLMQLNILQFISWVGLSRWLLTMEHLSTCIQCKTGARLARWALALQPYQYHIEHRPGTSNGNADGLSRQSWHNDGTHGTDSFAVKEREGGVEGPPSLNGMVPRP